MLRNPCSLVIAGLAVVSAGAGSRTLASPILVDGGTADWGPTIADNNGSVFNFLSGIGLVGSMVEDSDDAAGDDAFLGPNRGGQNYDAEAMAVAIQGGTLYGLIVSGQRPDNGFKRFAPGDILISTSGATYAIEVGGRAGGGGFANSIAEGSAGSKYDLSGSGFTEDHDNVGPSQTAGSIWKNPNFIRDPISPQTPVQISTANPGTLVGTADYVYTRDAFTTQHSVIEFSFPLSFLTGDTIVSVEWRPACGNDELMVVPEPATALFLASAGLVALRRKRS